MSSLFSDRDAARPQDSADVGASSASSAGAARGDWSAAAATLRLHNALLAEQTRILERVAIGAPLDDTLADLISFVEAQEAGMRCGILIVADDGEHFRRGHGPRLPEIYHDKLDGARITPPYLGACGEAADCDTVIDVADIATDPRWSDDWRKLLLHCGLRALRALRSTPVHGADGKVLAAFAMYYDEPRDPQPANPQLIEIATHLAGIAIERERSQLALRDSEMRFRTIVNQSATGVVQVESPTGRMTLVNRRWCEMLGYSEAELLKMTIADVTHPDDLAATLKAVTELAEGGADFTIDKRYLRKDGSILWATSSVSALRGPTGAYLGLVAVALDISERKRDEEARLQRISQFETLLNEAPLGVYLVDADFRLREVNPTAMPVFGGIPDPIGRDFADVVRALWPPENADKIIGRFRHTLETGDTYIVPERVESRSGWPADDFYEWQINRIALPDGRFGVVCYFRNVTVQVQARFAVAESEQRLRFMAESMPQKIFTATPSGDVDYFNQQWTEFSGLSLDEIKAWGWTQFIHPDDLEENIRVWQRSIDTGEPFEFVHRFRRADGAYRWHLSRAHAMRDAGGAISMWIGSNTDIHEQKELAEVLTQAREQQKLLLREMSHRMKNLFAVAAGLVAISARSAKTPADLARSVRDRLGALASAHELVRPDVLDLTGRDDCLATLSDLLAAIFSPYLDVKPGSDPRVICSGPTVSIGEKAATGLALVFHELATNAVKYGALSVSEGCIEIRWSLDDDELLLTWQEHNGPPLDGPPAAEGFGSLLVRRSIGGQLGGEISRDWKREGLVIGMSAPVERLQA